MQRKRQTQLYLAPQFKPRLEHGGGKHKGKRKLARPVTTKKPMHLTMRASAARGPWSLLRKGNRLAIEHTLRTLGKKHGVQIHDFANVGNHLHIVVRATTRRGFQAFLRSFAGITARIVTGAKKAAPQGRFWDDLAYSRIVEGGRQGYLQLKRYLELNRVEATHGVHARRLIMHALNSWP